MKKYKDNSVPIIINKRTNFGVPVFSYDGFRKNSREVGLSDRVVVFEDDSLYKINQGVYKVIEESYSVDKSSKILWFQYVGKIPKSKMYSDIHDMDEDWKQFFEVVA